MFSVKGKRQNTSSKILQGLKSSQILKAAKYLKQPNVLIQADRPHGMRGVNKCVVATYHL